MAYDEKLAARVRTILDGEPGFSEKHMFGGICFLLNGNMCCGLTDKDLMLRVDKEQYPTLLKKPGAREMDFTGRALKGFLYIDHDAVKTSRSLKPWIERARSYAAGLPKKKPKPKKPRKTKATAIVSEEVNPPYQGFSPKLFRFLRDLDKNNTKTWFDEHRDQYEEHYIGAAKAFVDEIGPRLATLRPVTWSAKVNGSIFRINRDVRFSKDKTPYNPHLSMWFWEGEKRGFASPGFYMRFTANKLIMGAGLHAFDKAQLPSFREAVVHDGKGGELAKLITKLEKKGYVLGDPARKKVPRGFDPGHPRANLLLRHGLTMSVTTPTPKEAKSADFVKYCLKHYKALAPISGWIADRC